WAPPPSDSRLSHPPGPSPSGLETRAEGLEKAGDFDGAMEALLASHSAGSSQAVMLAHGLSQRHPGAFQYKGCPVSNTQSGLRPTLKPATADNALTSSTVGNGGGGGGGGGGGPSESLSAPS
ncbi:unnamed protein product, partial [Laminaria digitata]